MASNRGSKEGDKHPYMRIGTWLKDPFWNRQIYSQKWKDYYNKWIMEELRQLKNIAALEDNLK